MAKLAQEQGRQQEAIAGDAVTAWLEDLEDIAAADRVVREGYVRHSEDEVRKRLGLER